MSTILIIFDLIKSALHNSSHKKSHCKSERTIVIFKVKQFIVLLALRFSFIIFITSVVFLLDSHSCGGEHKKIDKKIVYKRNFDWHSRERHFPEHIQIENT